MNSIKFTTLALLIAALATTAIAVTPVMAAQGPSASIGLGGATPQATSSPLSTPLIEPLVRSDCPTFKACLWEGPTYGGNRAFFEEEQSCHSLANITPHSWYNHMVGWYMDFKESGGNEFIIFEGEFNNNQPAFHGTLCIHPL